MSSLKGKRIVITRPRPQAQQFARLLKRAGASPIIFPVIKISPPPNTTILDDALLNISRYDWIIFTSTNGVDAAWKQMNILNIQQLPKHLKVGAIGPKTAAALEQHGIIVDFTPSKDFILEEIVPGLGDLQNKKILLLRANLARSILPEMIQAKGGIAHDIIAYHTDPTNPAPKNLAEIRSGIDIITFTSPSTVNNFSKIIAETNLNIHNLPGAPSFAYIGPITADRAQELELPIDVIADQYTTEGLILAIKKHYTQKERLYI